MSYDDTDRSELNTAREALGDTSNDSATELVTDDHINAVLAENGYNLGVALLAEELAARFAQKVGSVRLPSGLSVDWPERVRNWRTTATQYRTLAIQEATAAQPTRTSHRARNMAVW